MTAPTAVRRRLPLPSTRPALVAHLSDGHHLTRLVGTPNRDELEAEHMQLHVGGGLGHVHGWEPWGRGER